MPLAPSVSVAKVSAIPGFVRVETATANAQHFFKAAGGQVKITGLVENNARNIGAHFFAADVPFLDAADDHQFGIFRVDAPDIAAHPITDIKIASRVGGEAFDDDGLRRAVGVEIDQHGNFRGSAIGWPKRRQEKRERGEKTSIHAMISFLVFAVVFGANACFPVLL